MASGSRGLPKRLLSVHPRSIKVCASAALAQLLRISWGSDRPALSAIRGKADSGGSIAERVLSLRLFRHLPTITAPNSFDFLGDSECYVHSDK